MDFDLKNSQIYKAVIFYGLFPNWLLRIYRTSFLIIGSLPLAGLMADKFFAANINLNLGWAYVFLPLGFSVLFFELFGNYYLRYPKIPKNNNLAEQLEYEAAAVMEKAYIMANKIGEAKISTRTVLIAMFNDPVTAKVIRRLIPNFNDVKPQLVGLLGTEEQRSSGMSSKKELSPEMKEVLEGALKSKDRHKGYRVSILDILASMFDYNDGFKSFILNQGFDENDLEELSDWYENIWSFWREYKKFWSLDNLLRQPPIGRDWIYGYAGHLTAFSMNLTDKMEFSKPTLRLFMRQKEINQMEQVLARSGENNVLLVGEEGVGKDSIIADLAEMAAKGHALPQLNYRKIFDLNLSLVAGASKNIVEVQNLLLEIFNEAIRAGNVILVLRDFHNFIGEIGGLGRIDVSQVLLPYLKASNIQVIATTTPQAFHKFIESRSELSSIFERIDISEPSATETRRILEEAVPGVESRSGVIVTYGAIKQIVDGADKFIRSSPFPEKAFALLSEVVSYNVAAKKRLITREDVEAVISRKTGVPLGPVEGDEKVKLTRLEELMHKELVGQNRAVQVVASTMRRLRTGLAKRGKPAGVFLFVGPTGVGKTQTAKILAKTYFGSTDRMLRFDMSEYQKLDSIDQFLGSTKTNEPGQFVTAVRDHPFSLILLDEIEKADKNILNIFLQVFDEGRLTDVFGRKINFEQNIIIATSNAGADVIRDLVKEGLDPSMEKEKIVDVLIKGGYFRPELLNRFDEIVVFHPLSQVEVGLISGLLMDNLATRMKDQGYIFKPTQDVTDYVSKVGFDPQFGARPMERVIRDKVESAIAKKILDGDIVKGKPFSLKQEDL